MSTAHWDSMWSTRDAEEVSWYQRDPAVSRELIERFAGPSDAVVDVGGGASRLVDGLLAAGYEDLTVVDVAEPALAAARARLGAEARRVTWLTANVLETDLGRRFDLWHDRAVLHFFVDDTDRRRYVEALRRATTPTAHVVLATFGPDGPTQCSGLPVRRCDVDEMGRTLGEGFALLDRVEENHRTPSGVTQQFVYGVFRRELTAARS